MKFVSVNRLQDFGFHDSEIQLIEFDNKKLVLGVKFLNIHKNTEHNSFDTDMEIDFAQISFDDILVKEFSHAGAQITYPDGTAITEPLVVFEDDVATTKFISELKKGIIVFDFQKYEDDLYCMDTCGNDPLFSVKFSFGSVKIEWDKFRQVSWYENK